MGWTWRFEKARCLGPPGRLSVSWYGRVFSGETACEIFLKFVARLSQVEGVAINKSGVEMAVRRWARCVPISEAICPLVGLEDAVMFFGGLIIPCMLAAVCWLISVTFSVRCSGSSSPRSWILFSSFVIPIDLALSAASDSCNPL
jgi:hypothetical protein